MASKLKSAKNSAVRAAARRLGLSGSQRHRVIIARVAERMGRVVPGNLAARVAMLVEFNRNTTAPPRVPKQPNRQCPPSQDLSVVGDEFLSSYAWRRLRMEVIKEYGARCQCCGASPKDGAVINVDHIKPRRLFPELALDRSNLQVLCNACNHGKGNWDQTDWRDHPAHQAAPPASLPAHAPRLVKATRKPAVDIVAEAYALDEQLRRHLA